MKKLRCAYLYAAGHAVLIYEKNDRDAGNIEFAEIHQKWTDAQLSFEGRLIFTSGNVELLHLAKRAHRISADLPHPRHGSDASRAKGVAIGNLKFEMRPGSYMNSLCFHDMPGFLSGPYTYQPDVVEDCPAADLRHWGSYPVGKFHPAKQSQPAALAA